MPTYAIGDIQGCFVEFQKLLEKIQFSETTDRLWIAGDLVNRGPQSLETLRFMKSLGPKHQIVLGNHDIHLLAVSEGIRPSRKEDTFDAILKAPDRDEIIDWLRKQPLFVHDPVLKFSMVHAGLPPSWSLAEALTYADTANVQLSGDESKSVLAAVYQFAKNKWDDSLTGINRIALIISILTRIRYCDIDGHCDWFETSPIGQQPPHLIPWFHHPYRKTKGEKIIFGHWATLLGVTHEPNTFAIDTGCCWGHELTAFRLEDEQRFMQAAEK